MVMEAMLVREIKRAEAAEEGHGGRRGRGRLIGLTACTTPASSPQPPTRRKVRAWRGFEEPSVLDTVLDKAKTLQRCLNTADNAKGEEYLHSIRAIETGPSKDEQWIGAPQIPDPLPEPKPGLAGRDEIALRRAEGNVA